MHTLIPFFTLFTMIEICKSLATPRPPTNNRRKLSGFLFDIDGTLVNSDPIHLAVFQELLFQEQKDGEMKLPKNNDAPINEEFFRKKIAGRNNSLIMADLFPHWSIERREAWSIKKEKTFRDKASTQMMDLKMPGLDRLKTWIIGSKSGLRRAAVTNAPRLNAEAMLSGIGYYDDKFFETLVIGDECERPKPDPFPYLKACRDLDVKAEECIVFEDSPSGARAGVEAGAFVIGVMSGQEEATLVKAGCSLVIDDFDDPTLWYCLENDFFN